MSSVKPTRGRDFFLESGHEVAASLPEPIRRSWLRCQQLGLQEKRPPAVEPVTRGRLREMRESHETLWRAARGELESLAEEVGGSGSVVILSDEEGWILAAEGSTAFLQRAGRLALTPGACWSEDVLGTNAIGTAIVEGACVEVYGGQHYFAPHEILSCVSSPIFDPYGRLAGVLDISGDARAPQGYALSLVRMATRHIEHRYFEAGIEGCELLRLHADPGLLGTAAEGLLAFRGGRLMAANQTGLKLLGVDRGDIGHLAYDALFDASLSRVRREGVLLDRHGQMLHGRVEAPPESSRRAAGSLRTSPGQSSAGEAASAAIFDAPLQQDIERALRVLDAGLPVLVQGETGSGKEVFAHELHRRSTRADKPFVAINCAALPEGLIEAELFGYEDGAFTGARRRGSPGLLRQAEGGVLFLDEIGDMPLALQSRLLRVLQDHELSPLGGGKPVKVEFELICATHRDLEEAIAEQRFRADLYYRIAHHCVRIAPVREHPDRHQLVAELWARLGQGRRLSTEALNALAGYAWPGNLRQLSACLRTLVALQDADGVVGLTDLPGYLKAGWSPPVTGSTDPVDVPAVVVRAAASDPAVKPAALADLHTLTDQLIKDTLQACGGNISRAARQLGISRSTLYRRQTVGSDAGLPSG
ncbi:sigma-54-dependent Fis family transcriptional regulator [Frateuria aurantia]